MRYRADSADPQSGALIRPGGRRKVPQSTESPTVTSPSSRAAAWTTAAAPHRERRLQSGLGFRSRSYRPEMTFSVNPSDGRSVGKGMGEARLPADSDRSSSMTAVTEISVPRGSTIGSRNQ